VARCRSDDDARPAVTGAGGSVEDALAALTGVADRRAPAFLAWGALDVTLTRVEVDGLSPPALAGLLGRLAAEGVAAVSVDAPAAARRWVTAVRWDQADVDDAVVTATRAGFRVVGVAPSALLLWRAGGSDAAHVAARVAAGLVTIGPLRPLTGDHRAPAAPRQWVVERLADPDPARPPPRPARRWWPPGRR
jgi:hypothetical protein